MLRKIGGIMIKAENKGMKSQSFKVLDKKNLKILYKNCKGSGLYLGKIKKRCNQRFKKKKNIEMIIN